MKKLQVVCIVVVLLISCVNADFVSRALLTDEELDDLRENRDLRVYEENEMHVILHKSGRLICLDKDYVNRSMTARNILNVPFCKKPRIWVSARRYWWDKDKDEGVTTYTLKRR